MSRTYRRKKGDRPNHLLDECVLRGSSSWHWVPSKNPKYELAKYHSDGYQWMSTPMHWIHDFHEVQFRAKTKNALKKINLGNYEEVDINPCFKKPHIYYW